MISRWVRNPLLIRQNAREQLRRDLSRRIEWLEDSIQSLDVESRLRMRAVMRLYKDLLSDIEDPDLKDYTLSTLRASVAQIGSLTERALRLAKKRKDLQQYLDRTDQKVMEDYIKDLNSRIKSVNDPINKNQFEQALVLKKRELDDYQAIATTVSRIDGQLENVECAFSSLRARIVRLKAADITQWDAAGQQLKSDLETLSSVVETLEQSVNEALSI